MPSLRFGILGAADIARRYTGEALKSARGVELVGVAARDRGRAAALADDLGVSVFDSYEAIVDSPDVDAIYIPLPIGLHAQWALRAIERGKHVLCEKSLAGSLGDAERIIDAATAAGVLVMENFMCTYHEQNLLVRRTVASGGIGSVAQAALSFGFPPFREDDLKYNRELQGGALNDAGAYCLKMARFHIPSAPLRILAVADYGDRDVDVRGSAMVTFTGGEVAHLAWGFDNDYRNETRLWGQTGSIEIDRSFSIPPDRVPSVTVIRNGERRQESVAPMNHFVALIEDFASRVVERRLEDAARELRVQAIMMEAARVSARDASVVELASFPSWPLTSE